MRQQIWVEWVLSLVDNFKGKKCYILLSFKSSLLTKATFMSVGLCWQIISRPVGLCWNTVFVTRRTIILARSCTCTSFISLGSGWLSLQGPLLCVGQMWMGEVWHNTYFCIWSLRRAFLCPSVPFLMGHFLKVYL